VNVNRSQSRVTIALDPMSMKHGLPRFDGREIEAVLIDAGGVLVDPNWEIVASVLERHGVRVEQADLAAADPHLRHELDDADVIRRTTDETRRARWVARLVELAGGGGNDAAAEAAAREIEALHGERGIWELVPQGVRETLDRLCESGLRLSLASNAEPSLRRKLEELGLADRFDHLAISGEVGIEKPDPRFFLGALDTLGVPPERAVHVGDLYEIDVVGARSAGLGAILVDAADLYGDRDVPRIHALPDLPELIGLGRPA
jgi:HAD superfamily hydrolase (TIGR01509 family)